VGSANGFLETDFEMQNDVFHAIQIVNAMPIENATNFCCENHRLA
jgi:hypothetical protein